MDTKIPPIHPGEILLKEFLKPMQLSQYRIAKDINVPPIRINEIVHGKRAISADTALRLGKYFLYNNSVTGALKRSLGPVQGVQRLLLC